MPRIDVPVDDNVECVTNEDKNTLLKLLISERIGEKIVSITRYDSGWKFSVVVADD